MVLGESLMTTNYDYRGMMVEYWDLLRGDTSKWSSRPYFLTIIRESGEPALDVACGTGRLLLDYMQEGIEIDGVDISPEMIAKARENADQLGLKPNLYVQAMQKLALPRRYQTIIVPSSSFLHLTDVSDIREALKRFYEHLNPGGILAMSLRVMDPNPIEVDWEIDSEAVRPFDGALVRKWFRCSYDVENRIQHTEDRYEIIKDGKIIHSESYISSPFLTWYKCSEALEHLRQAGFSGVNAHSNFKPEPATDEDTSYVVLGKRL
jgi:ubiquinone/menaquinone biosynthesis C-methylase UbiE